MMKDYHFSHYEDEYQYYQNHFHFHHQNDSYYLHLH